MSQRQVQNPFNLKGSSLDGISKNKIYVRRSPYNDKSNAKKEFGNLVNEQIILTRDPENEDAGTTSTPIGIRLIQERKNMLTNANPVLFAVAMVILIGLMAGVSIGLVIGFLLKRQKPAWADMTRTDKAINIALVIVCSAIVIAFLAFRFL